ncbi:MAG: protein translocase subunit SecF [Chloroflexi bacterium]|jgi:preprotein translocase SecF subunit|nr:protein translocase subunit SecF [Chloroflexota bacterium]
MFNLVQKRRWYFVISAILIIPGIVAMIYSTIAFGSPVRLGIDFTGGSLLELRFEQPVELADIRPIIQDGVFSDATVQTVGDHRDVVIRTSLNVGAQEAVAAKEALKARLSEEIGPVTEMNFSSVGPSIGRETTRAALVAILATSAAILIFIAIAFRRVPNAFRYGACAVAKMLHDVLFLLGVASILGLLVGWEVDSLFLTAVLTVIGFSVQDVIVVFDRIRENVNRRHGEPFETIVNRSLLETLHRSLATQLNAIFVMVAIILFGGVTIRNFLAIMLIGMVTGTYSSIFFAVPLLVTWQQHVTRRLTGNASVKRAPAA